MNPRWVIDTDMLFHKVSVDRNVSAAAQKLCRENSPLAISEFTKVEIKGNRIRYLSLLRRKIESSSNFAEAVAKIQNSGGGPSIRNVITLFVEFLKLVGSIGRAPEPWNETKGLLMTRIDSEIFVTWNSLSTEVAKVLTEFNCTRATEEPRLVNGQWSTTIQNCSAANTNCTIVDFMKVKIKSILALEAHLSGLPSANMTQELVTMLDIIRETITKGAFPWQGTTCRRVGDLLIGLQSGTVGGLITSNQKEHKQLHRALGYHLKLFPLADIRQK